MGDNDFIVVYTSGGEDVELIHMQCYWWIKPVRWWIKPIHDTQISSLVQCLLFFCLKGMNIFDIRTNIALYLFFLLYVPIIGFLSFINGALNVSKDVLLIQASLSELNYLLIKTNVAASRTSLVFFTVWIVVFSFEFAVLLIFVCFIFANIAADIFFRSFEFLTKNLK